jgi:hypothetical protein
MADRVLLIHRRSVPAARLADYHLAWDVCRDAAIAAGARAWRYRSAADETRFIEFVEFGGGRDPRRDPAAAAGLATLDDIVPADPEEWHDATGSPKNA